MKAANLARFCQTSRMLLGSGLNIDETLEIAHNSMGNYYYREALEVISQNIRTGSKLSENLSVYEDLFPTIVSRMIRVGEESGQLVNTLKYLEEYYQKEVDTQH